MSDILIKGMEMPKDGTMIFAIRPDGMVEDVMGCYVGKTVPVQKHGRLIDADALLAQHYGRFGMIDEVAREAIKNAPTIIPADKE